MSGKSKLSALDAFHSNMEDAHLLVGLARALTSSRTYRMRRELRERLGSALRMSRNEWDDLDCIESRDFFVVLKPDGSFGRQELEDMRPLLRQALVAGCSAFETYVNDRVMELVGPAMRSDVQPTRMLDIRMSVRDWFDIEQRYQRKGWGVREVIGRAVREVASPAPGSVGKAFAIVDERDVLKRADVQRKSPKGSATECLERIYGRRNKIAHAGDRVGRGRASITVEEVDDDLESLGSIVEALNVVTSQS